MYKNTAEILQLDVVLQRVADFAMSSVARKRLVNTQSSKDMEHVNDILDCCSQACDMLCSEGDPIKQFDDISIALDKASLGALCQPSELYSIGQLLSLARAARYKISNVQHAVHLCSFANRILDTKAVESKILDAILLDHVKDSASTKLKSIRRQIVVAKEQLKEKLNSYVNKHAKLLQDGIVTVRNDRFVLPVKSEHRSSMAGLLHDQSSSGATCYIEPLEFVEYNNNILALNSAENAETERILYQLGQDVRDNIEAIRSNFDIVVHLDIVFAKARYSISVNAVRPYINNTGRIRLNKARHPLIDADKVVPIDIEIDTHKVVIISGPNTGGKSVSLKTVGLCCAMAACGIFVPCSSDSIVSVFDNIFCLIGDGQDMTQSLSTFSAHIMSIKSIVEQITDKSLVLLDELGSGTDPQEGAALAQGIVHYISSKRATAIITSHYSQLKEYASSHSGLINASMQFDTNSLQPTYRVLMGVAGASHALSIATKLGLNKEIIDYAYSNLSTQQIQLNKLLVEAQQKSILLQQQLDEIQITKQDIHKQLEQAIVHNETLTKKQTKLDNEKHLQVTKAVEKAQDRADSIINQLKSKLQQADEKALFEAKALSRQLEDINSCSVTKYVPIATLPRKGDKVIVISLNSQGTVKDVEKNKITVNIGNVAIKCDLSNLAHPKVYDNTKGTQSQSSSKTYKDKENNSLSSNSDRDGDSTREIVVIGCTVQEGVQIVESFVQECIYDNCMSIRVVHGKGSGVLGRGIQQYMKSSHNVKSFRYGGYGEGDRGVTIAVLQQ